MDVPDEQDAPSGAAVLYGLTAIGGTLVTALLGWLAGLSAGRLLVLVLAVPTLGYGGVAAVLARRSDPLRAESGQALEGPAAPPAVPLSDELLGAQELLTACVARGAPEPELVQAALVVYEAQLAWARDVLRSTGGLPPAVKDELLVQHRGVTRLLEQLGAPR